MKKIMIFLMGLLPFSVVGQEVCIKDKNHKVIICVDESKLDDTIRELSNKAVYTSRWIENKEVQCPIEWSKIKLMEG